MEEKKFDQVDGKPVLAQLLAYVHYQRVFVEKIAEGANPSDFHSYANVQPQWGILYVCEGGAGFYVHASESPIASMYRKSSGKELEPIDIFIPKESVTAFETDRAKTPSSRLGKFIARYFRSRDESVLISWDGKNGKSSMRFFITKGDAASFERVFRDKIR